jgi:hypothetical protein
VADLTPAQELRAAATRLRQLAEAAKELTGDGNGEWFPWGVVQQTEYVKWPEPQPVPVPFAFDDSTELADGGYEPTGEAFVAHARWEHDSEEAWHGCEFFAGPIPEALARFIASMHPGFALAVAEWLEAEVAMMASLLATGAYVDSRNWPAVKIAQAFLGSKEGGDV